MNSRSLSQLTHATVNRVSSIVLPRRGAGPAVLSAAAGERLGQVPCLPQVSPSKAGGASFSHPHHHMTSSSTHVPISRASSTVLPSWGVGPVLPSAAVLTVDRQAQLSHFNDLRHSSPPTAVGRGVGEGISPFAHATVWQMRGQTRSLTFTFLGPAHHSYQ